MSKTSVFQLELGRREQQPSQKRVSRYRRSVSRFYFLNREIKKKEKPASLPKSVSVPFVCPSASMDIHTGNEERPW